MTAFELADVRVPMKLERAQKIYRALAAKTIGAIQVVDAEGALDPTKEVHAITTTTNGVAATGTLTFTDNAGDTQTVVIGGKTYTFQNSLVDADGNVQVGADAAESIANLVAAINLGAGAGTAYAASMTLHPTVSAAVGAGTTMVVTAKVAGEQGNQIATTETLANASWGAATLAGGAGDLTLTLADGTLEGQRVHLLYERKLGSGGVLVTPANLAGGTTLFLSLEGSVAALRWNGSAWALVPGSDGTVA